MLPWHSRSPAPSPIEHGWDMTGRHLTLSQAPATSFATPRSTASLGYQPPRIGAFHFSPNLDAGMRTLLPCSIVSGDFPISITWRKDGEPLSQELDVQEKRDEFASTLVFRRLGAKHSGNYTCTASNAAATAEYTASLTVRVPPHWVREPEDVSALSTQPAILHCLAGGHPHPTISWLRGTGDQLSEHTPLVPGPNIVVFENSSVLIREVDPSYEGHYICEAGNGIGGTISKGIFLRVNASSERVSECGGESDVLCAVAARFRTRAANVSGVAGQGVVLTCDAEGDLPLSVTWSAPHRVLAPERARTSERHSQRGVSSELRLDVLARHDAGPYHCDAANNFGRDRAIIYLSVRGTYLHLTSSLRLSIRDNYLTTTYFPYLSVRGTYLPT
ncbi:hypothetical protein PR048_024405 [Dryococelus australis]|uniref:Ig-like domain-containing protein n=1 Tax=Dryococelus australis TaxID=614101 RepID=A0ABQ9GNH0_9NEOP|nr:hypothetical protein PR048_024405 [Dryococelus australis]